MFFVLLPAGFTSAGDGAVGQLYAALGVGGVVVAGLAARLADSARPTGWMVLNLAIAGAMLAVVAPLGSFTLVLLIVAVHSGASVVADVIAETVMQRVLPPDAVARAFGIIDALVVSGMLIGSLLAPVLISVTDLDRALVSSGAVIAVLGALALPRFLAIDRATGERRRTVAPDLDLLDGLEVFDGASRRALEALAATLVRETHDAGVAIVVEGEPAASFYVVIDGTLEVRSGVGTSAEVVLDTLVPGDAFGEIGLLRRSPRRATVIALTPCVLGVVDGDAFVAAVQSDDRASVAFDRRISAVLASAPTESAPGAG